LINQIDLEIQDVYPEVKDSLYAFIEAGNLLDERQLQSYFERLGLAADRYEQITKLLLWYGFLGILRDDGSTTYIYDVNYEMRKLVALKKKRPETELVYSINPHFGPVLTLRPADRWLSPRTASWMPSHGWRIPHFAVGVIAPAARRWAILKHSN